MIKNINLTRYNGVVSFSLATTYGKANHKETTWHHIACQGKVAEQALPFIRVGAMLWVSGKITYSAGTNGNPNRWVTIWAGMITRLESALVV